SAAKPRVVLPTFSNSAMSWASHDVHDPQSAVEPRKISHSLFLTCSRIAGVLGMLLGKKVTWHPAKRASSALPIRLSAPAPPRLLFQSRPMRRPSSDFGRARSEAVLISPSQTA